MVEKHTDFEIQCDVPDGKQYILATDHVAIEKQRDDCQQEITNCRKIMEKQGIIIAALEAERDEWKRRCERFESALRRLGVTAEYLSAIAEGRDNG